MAEPSWRRIGAAVASAALLAGVGACARPASVEPAPSASEPVCADLLMALPTELAGAERRTTTSQASRAWGDPPLVLRCGVDPLGPTTDPCLSVPDVKGDNPVDWVGATTSTDGVRTFTTYGWLPAVEMTIPDEYPGDQVLAELAPVITAVLSRDGNRECL